MWTKGAGGRFTGSTGGRGGTGGGVGSGGPSPAKIAALKARIQAAQAALNTSRATTQANLAARQKATASKLRAAAARSQTKQALDQAQATGIRGLAVPSTGLRAASFAHLRSGGAVHGGPPRIAFTPNGPRIIDGRHRIMLARERGEKTIDAVVYVYGKREGVKAQRKMKIPI